MEVLNFFQEIYFWFSNIPWREIYFIVRDIFLITDFLLFIGFIFVAVKARSIQPVFSRLAAPPTPSLDVVFFRKQWQMIKERAEAKPPQSFALAIIEADKFVDDVLKKLGIPGEHLADRLEKLNQQDFKTLNKLWEAHRFRNELVHTPDFDISKINVHYFLKIYEDFLKEIEAI